MSLYICLDLINQELLNLKKKRDSLWRTLPFLSKPFPKPSKLFLNRLKGKLQQRINDENYENLHDEIGLITDHLKQEMPASIRKILFVTLFGLKIIQWKYELQPQPTSEMTESSLTIKQKISQVLRLQELLNLKKKRDSLWRILPSLSKSFPKSRQLFLNLLKEKLQQRINDENYENLHDEIGLITDHLKQEMPASIRKILFVTLFDLQSIQREYKLQSQPIPEMTEAPLVTIPKITQAYLDTYRIYKDNYIAEINQAKLPKRGGSSGVCLGFTYSMVNPHLSPYERSGLRVDLNQAIHDYQKWQTYRRMDQQTIKRTRLTRFYFYPDPTEQAKKLLNEVEKNQHLDKHLMVTKKGARGRHACYLSLRQDGEIRYMDPNVGAFSFTNKDDFINFYTRVAQLEKATEIDYRFFNLDELKHHENQKEEIKTWRGMLRTLIMGPKYRDNWFRANLLILLAHAVPAGIGGALLGAGLGSVFPVGGTGFGALLGAALGATLGAGAYLLALTQHHSGLLAIPHLLMDQLEGNQWQDIENLTIPISPKPASEAQANTTQKIASDSTKNILSAMMTPENKVQDKTVSKPLAGTTNSQPAAPLWTKTTPLKISAVPGNLRRYDSPQAPSQPPTYRS